MWPGLRQLAIGLPEVVHRPQISRADHSVVRKPKGPLPHPQTSNFKFVGLQGLGGRNQRRHRRLPGHAPGQEPQQGRAPALLVRQHRHPPQHRHSALGVVIMAVVPPTGHGKALGTAAGAGRAALDLHQGSGLGLPVQADFFEASSTAKGHVPVQCAGMVRLLDLQVVDARLAIEGATQAIEQLGIQHQPFRILQLVTLGRAGHAAPIWDRQDLQRLHAQLLEKKLRLLHFSRILRPAQCSAWVQLPSLHGTPVIFIAALAVEPGALPHC
mmetsp:Transcript_37752/g.90280  ORF Transcript_37752/g.90280 Transcript_37752/m.90280 type:complete len:270 (-) Transcript_37752:2481-3290(-)